MKGIISKLILCPLFAISLISCGSDNKSSDSDPLVTDTTDSTDNTPTTTSPYNVETLFGRTDGKGIDLVIIGDAFTESDMDLFKAAASELTDYLFSYEPLFKKQSKGWNIHRVDVISETSDLESTTDTAFESYYNCTGIQRAICLDDGKVLVEIAKAVPQFDYILVLINNSEYGGAAVSALSTVSMHDDSKSYAIHELGHMVANLADEYTYGAESAPISEPTYPNVTLNTNPETVKWKHWLSDPNVDIFEGGLNVQTGVWRPTNDSIMHNLYQPFYPVNLEAWTLAIYSEIGTHYSITPESNTLSHLAGSEIDFSVELSLGDDAQKVDWYVDGVLTLSNSRTFSCCSSNTDNYSVRAEISDISGAVKSDPNNYSSSSIIWNVTVN
jgi:hypothetical protein